MFDKLSCAWFPLVYSPSYLVLDGPRIHLELQQVMLFLPLLVAHSSILACFQNSVSSVLYASVLSLARPFGGDFCSRKFDSRLGEFCSMTVSWFGSRLSLVFALASFVHLYSRAGSFHGLMCFFSFS